jgi:probable phosphoglycerate mutase
VRLLLVRHGHIDPAVPLGLDSPLSPRGAAQADWLGPGLGGEGITTLLASPVRRALETARRLSRPLGLEVGVELALSEFLLGWEGERSYDDVQISGAHLAIWHPEHRGGEESLADFQTRVTALLTAVVLRAAPGDTVALVTHAGVIDAALRWAWGLTSRNPWLAEAELPHCSVTEIRHWPRGRHPEGAPRYSVITRIGDAGALPAELFSS